MDQSDHPVKAESTPKAEYLVLPSEIPITLNFRLYLSSQHPSLFLVSPSPWTSDWIWFLYSTYTYERAYSRTMARVYQSQ